MGVTFKVNIPMRMATRKPKEQLCYERDGQPLVFEKGGHDEDFKNVTPESIAAFDAACDRGMKRCKEWERQDMIAAGTYNPETFDAEWEAKCNAVDLDADTEENRKIFQILDELAQKDAA